MFCFVGPAYHVFLWLWLVLLAQFVPVLYITYSVAMLENEVKRTIFAVKRINFASYPQAKAENRAKKCGQKLINYDNIVINQ